jgi:thiamine pyrophosphate-dependent acetolactate synthase large subunit-like protein
VKSYDCLELLASWMDEYMIAVTSIRGISREWIHLWKGPTTSGTMGQCIPLALGLSLAFPKRKVLALDSDGGTLFSTNALSTVANVNPPN